MQIPWNVYALCVYVIYIQVRAGFVAKALSYISDPANTPLQQQMGLRLIKSFVLPKANTSPFSDPTLFLRSHTHPAREVKLTINVRGTATKFDMTLSNQQTVGELRSLISAKVSYPSGFVELRLRGSKTHVERLLCSDDEPIRCFGLDKKWSRASVEVAKLVIPGNLLAHMLDELKTKSHEPGCVLANDGQALGYFMFTLLDLNKTSVSVMQPAWELMSVVPVKSSFLALLRPQAERKVNWVQLIPPHSAPQTLYALHVVHRLLTKLSFESPERKRHRERWLSYFSKTGLIAF